MTIDKELFIEAGIKYIYQLDEFDSKSVYHQIAAEFDEILELNNSNVLKERAAYFQIAEASDYSNHLIETDEGCVIAGIRHLGSDRNTPFIFVWPTFKISSVANIVDSVLPYFEMFKPGLMCYWCRPDCSDSGARVVQQRFIGQISEMIKDDLPLCQSQQYYEWYKSEYDKFHLEKPEFKNRIQINSKAVMDGSAKEGLLYLLIRDQNKIGLISGERERFLNKPAIYLNEILIAQRYRGRGYAKRLLASFVNTLDADYFVCDIDADNLPSIQTALRSGQKVFSQEIFVRI